MHWKIFCFICAFCASFTYLHKSKTRSQHSPVSLTETRPDANGDSPISVTETWPDGRKVTAPGFGSTGTWPERTSNKIINCQQDPQNQRQAICLQKCDYHETFIHLPRRQVLLTSLFRSVITTKHSFTYHDGKFYWHHCSEVWLPLNIHSPTTTASSTDITVHRGEKKVEMKTTDRFKFKTSQKHAHNMIRMKEKHHRWAK